LERITDQLALGCVLHRQNRWSEGALVTLGAVIPFSSGLLMSQRRYMWVLLPAFVLLARWGERRWGDRGASRFRSGSWRTSAWTMTCAWCGLTSRRTFKIGLAVVRDLPSTATILEKKTANWEWGSDSQKLHPADSCACRNAARAGGSWT